ncbi:phage holin family protein [Paenibacillus pasadenensis]|uniref:phage holin family protein n=1 Tax=Paenibacillus pasadenensis TaxID=217090 RepID=UPI00203BD484|nr:phage holin family protein [Paenibacillus pasadenensis]MCM3747318.1 phage holin family protein [Paenibacillus pasadenensis]
MELFIKSTIGAVGTTLSFLFILTIADYVTGMCASVIEGSGLSSRIGFKGLLINCWRISSYNRRDTVKTKLTYRLILLVTSLILLPLSEETWQSVILYATAAYSGLSLAVYIMVKVRKKSV